MNRIAASRLLSNREAAQYLGIAPFTLKRWRSRTYKNRHRIPYLKIGRSIRYREVDLVNWVNSRPEAA
jgi:hypothetical protein